MPKTKHDQLEEALKRRARELGLEKGSDRYNRYVWGTLAKAKAGDGEQPER